MLILKGIYYMKYLELLTTKGKKNKFTNILLYILVSLITFGIVFCINLFYQNALQPDMYIHQSTTNILFCCLASLTFLFYLKTSHYFDSISNSYCIALALAYGLSSFAILNNTDIAVMLIYSIIPVFFLSLEQFEHNKGYVFFCVICTIALCINAVVSCITFIYIIVFFLIFSKTEFNRRIIDFFHLLLCYAFSFLISSAFCIPQLSAFYKENHLSSYSGFSINYDILSFLSRFLPGSAPSEYFTYGRGLDLYFGMFFFIVTVLYFFNTSIDRLERLKNLVFLSFLIGTLQLSPLMYLIELCQSTETISIYYSFFFTFYCLRLSAISLNSLSSISKKSIISGILFVILLNTLTILGASHNFMAITKQFIVCLLFLYCLGILSPKLSTKASTQKLLPYFVIFELIINIAISTNLNILPSSLDTHDKVSFINNLESTQQAEKETSDSTDIEDYNKFYNNYYASRTSTTVYLLKDYITITEQDKVKYSVAGDLNELDEFNIRAHILGIDEDIFVQEDIPINFNTSNKYKITNEGNNIYCLEETPRALDSDALIVSYTYKNADNKNYIIHCTNNDYLIEDSGISEEFNGLLSFPISKNISYRFQLTIYSVNEDALNQVSEALFSDADPNMSATNDNNIALIYLIFSAIGVIILMHFTIDKGKKKSIDKLYHFKSSLCQARVLKQFKTFITTNKVYLLAFLMPTIIFIASMIFYNSAPFGSKSFLDSDGIPSTLATILNNYYNYKKGNITLSMLGGYVNGFFPGLYFLFYFPFLIFSASSIPAVLMITDAILLGLSGFFLCYYLTHRLNGIRASKNDWKLLIPAYIYSLNTFMIAMHSYAFWWYLLFALFPLLILFQERLVFQKKWFPYTILLAFCIFTNFNIALYICIFLVIHFFTCKFENIKDFIIKGFRFASFSLLSALCNYSNLSGLFLGVFTQRAGTGYAEADSVVPTFGFFTSYFNQWRQFMLFTPCKTITSDDGHINLYMGVLFLILMILFITSKKIELRQKLNYLIPTFILFISFNEQISAYLWNGLHYQINVPNRHTFLFAFIASLIAFEVLNIIDTISIKHIIFCIILTILFVCICQFCGDGNTTLAFVSTIVLIAIYLIISIICNYNEYISSYKIPIIIIVFTLEMGLNVFFDCSYFFIDDITIYGDYEAQAKFNTYLMNTDNENAYRFSLPATCGSNNGFIINAPTGTYFNSSLSNYLQNMNYYYGLYYGNNFIMTHHNTTPLGLSLSSAKYIELPQYTTASLGDSYLYKYIGSINNHFILQNPDALSLGIYVPDEISHMPENTLHNAVTFQNYLVSIITRENDEILSGPIILSSDPDTSCENTITFQTPDGTYISQENAQKIILSDENRSDPVFTSHNLYCDISIIPEKDGPIYLYASELIYLGEGNAGQKSHFTIPYPNQTFADNYTFTCYTFDTELYHKFIKKVKSNQLDNVTIDDNVLTATIDYDEDGYTMFSLPCSTTWKIYIDDVEVQADDIMNSYLFIKTPAGKHELKMIYTNQSSIKSMLVSLSIVVSLCLIYIIGKKKTHT